jgi:hypothetical protein
MSSVPLLSILILSTIEYKSLKNLTHKCLPQKFRKTEKTSISTPMAILNDLSPTILHGKIIPVAYFAPYFAMILSKAKKLSLLTQDPDL